MEEVLRALNALVERGVIRNYAIGGAIGAAFYIEAVQTEDVDAFVFLPKSADLLITLTPVYAALQELGGIVDQGHVRFGEWPLQILTDANELIAEAIENAVTVEYDGAPTRVFLPEYLCAIALQTGRGKDLLRVATFLQMDRVQTEALHGLVERFSLQARMDRTRSFDALG